MSITSPIFIILRILSTTVPATSHLVSSVQVISNKPVNHILIANSLLISLSKGMISANVPLWISTGPKEYHMSLTKLILTLIAPMIKQLSPPWKKQVCLKGNRTPNRRKLIRRSQLPSPRKSRSKRRALSINLRTHRITRACSRVRDRSPSRTISSLMPLAMVMSSDISRRLTQVTP